MTTQKKTAAPADVPAPEPELAVEIELQAPIVLEDPLPFGAELEPPEEVAPPEAQADATPAPAGLKPRRFIVLNGPRSYGPVIINGKATRAKAGEVHEVSDVEERADILATGLFRGATPADFAKSGPSGPITRESLPPGALKGGLIGP